MKNMKRALRRHHRARLLQREYKRIKYWGYGFGDEEFMAIYCRIGINTRARCNKMCCCNPRSYGELTMQERRANQLFIDI